MTIHIAVIVQGRGQREGPEGGARGRLSYLQNTLEKNSDTTYLISGEERSGKREGEEW